MTTTTIQQAITTAPFSSSKSPMAWLAMLLRPLAARFGSATAAANAPVDAAHAAAALRALAYKHQPTEPGFAADLFAAADRHQAIAEDDPAATPTPQRR